MPSITKVGFWVFCFVFLWERLRGAEGRCSPADPAGAQHPVRALQERVQAGRGCAAWEQGNKETHVIALQRATNSPENMVSVFLKPLNPPSGPLRALHLVLSSILPISWWLEADLLPPDLPVLVQVSPNSSVQSQTLRLTVRTVRSLPFRLHTLHRWAMKHHGNLSSLVHTKQGNRVYIHLGEDPTLPAVCQLQSSFLFPNYMTSDLQPQTVKGCSYPRESEASPEVHVIRLRSAGPGISGSLQADVTVSLVPPVATSEPHKVVLILSSSVPVNWVITATGVRGHVSVHSSNSVSLPFQPEPNVTMSSRLLSEPPAGSDPLVWAAESGYTNVRSYTEAELANRFVIQLAEGGTNQERLPVVNCDGGLLSVTVDQQKLKSLSLPAVAMTLRDQRCQAVSNGSHFLLALPIIFCRTEGILQEQPRGVLYKNTLLLWRVQPQSVAAHEENRKSRPSFSVHISCFATSPSKSAANDDNVTLPLIGRFARGARQGPESAPAPHHLPVPILTSGPALQLGLFVTDSYEQTWTGPCVITADHRVFVEISANASLADVVQVESCFVSPQSDPKKSPFWTVVSDGCSSDPSVRLGAKAGGDEDEDAYAEEEEDVGREEDRNGHSGRRFSPIDNGSPNVGDSEKAQLLRFSFVLRPVYNESMQFVHCSLRLCLSDSAREETTQEASSCQSGVLIPPLVPGSSRHQCEIRNLSRPMVVTRPISLLVTKLEPSAGQRTKSLSPESSRFVLHEGLLMGIVFAAFLVGVSLMGGLWCIHTYTGGHPESFRNAHLTNQTQEGCNNRTPPFLSDQSSSSV
ncbi:transforming growth factor beta receptor type 3-like [Xiphophorus maculatus]|uniref:Transforming growth factor beta receptor type 3-like n=1 Tax=Xiphophorus maculatus TaxID=8083 RepID=M4A398_XIPMA|nr:transforming growth factor beta receptor type 3-like [Xiphophorus maculatus]